MGLAVHAEEVAVPVQPIQSQLLDPDAGDNRSTYLEIQQTLDEMLAFSLGEEKPDAEVKQAFGKLSELLDKASQSEKLVREVDELWKEVDQLRKQVARMDEELKATRTERDEVLRQLEAFTAQSEKWDAVTAGLRETIERLILGEYEYYEVKEGDTIQGIAANPMVYGDVTRAAWLRQVNEGVVKNLDNLRTGEVLVVPRFPRAGSYEF